MGANHWEEVLKFKYLSLVNTGDCHMQAMMNVRITAAKKVWHVLQS